MTVLVAALSRHVTKHSGLTEVAIFSTLGLLLSVVAIHYGLELAS
jgi:hypothetical protein